MKNFNIDNIKVSNKLDDKVKTSIEKAFKPTKKEKNILKKKIAVASVAIIGVGTLSLNNPTVLAKIKEFKTSIESLLNIENPEIEKYSNGFAEPVTSNDISVKINDLILDNHSIKISTSIDISKRKNKELRKKKIESIEPYIKLSINGKELNAGSSTFDFKKIDNNKFDYYIDNRLMDDSIKTDSNNFYPNNKIIEDIFNGSVDSKIKIKLEIPSLAVNYATAFNSDLKEYNIEQIMLEGTWSFEKEISLSELVSKTSNFKIDKFIEFKEKIFENNNKTITLKELTVSPISIALKYEKYLDSPFITFTLYDENNNIINPFDSRGDGHGNGPLYIIAQFNRNIQGETIKIVPTLHPQQDDNFGENIPLLDKAITVNIKTGEILE